MIHPVTKTRFTERLENLRRRSFRRGIWREVLSPLERSIANLTLKYVKEPKGRGLLKILAEIVTKIEYALGLGFYYELERCGRNLARRNAKLAIEWGNKKAEGWIEDQGYWRFLGLGLTQSAIVHR